MVDNLLNMHKALCSILSTEKLKTKTKTEEPNLPHKANVRVLAMSPDPERFCVAVNSDPKLRSAGGFCDCGLPLTFQASAFQSYPELGKTA